MKSTAHDHEEATPALPTIETAASFSLESDPHAGQFLPETATDGTGQSDTAPVRCCFYCGTVEESAAPFVERLGDAIFCDDSCKWDYAEQNKMIGGTPAQQKAPFQIDSLERYEWWTGKVADVAARRKRIIANFERQMRQLDADERRAMQLQPQAQKFVTEELQRTKAKRQSITTLHGTGTITRYAETVVLMDGATADPATVAKARELGCIKIVPEVPAVPAREEVDTAAYLKAAKGQEKDAALLPGCDTQPAREVFKFTLAPDDEDTAPKPTKASKKK